MSASKHLWPAVIAGFITSGAAFAAGEGTTSKPGTVLSGERPERGRYFYERPPVPEEPAAEEPKPRPKPPEAEPPKKEPPKKEPPRCSTPQTWSADCGFVDPKEDFDFQARQRDELLRQMVMKNNDPAAVEAFQHYMKWIMSRATEVSNLWQYNMVQNPELDPDVTNPTNSFGLQLASKVKSATEEQLFPVLAEEGELVYFTRHDCTYCHQMAPTVLELAKATGMRISTVSFDKDCVPGFAECVTGELATQTGSILQVGVVPSLFMRIKPQTWIRVGTGVVDQNTLKERMVQFFMAYRHAVLKGIKNSSNGRAVQDGSYQWSPTGIAEGAPLPSQSEIETILKTPTK